jgi:hypothetical protein
MDFMNRRANGAAARMWAAAAESGIGPHDPLAPFIDAMADAAERIETVGDELKTAAATIAVAPPTFTDDNLRTLAHALRPDLHRLARAGEARGCAGFNNPPQDRERFEIPVLDPASNQIIGLPP